MSNERSGRIRAKRLSLRKLEDRDAEPIAALAGDWDIARMTASIPTPTRHFARAWMQSLAPDEFVRAVEYQGELIGAVGYLTREDGSAEIGYWIGKPWWGRGFATEAAPRSCIIASEAAHAAAHLQPFHRQSRRPGASSPSSASSRSGPAPPRCDARNAEVETVSL